MFGGCGSFCSGLFQSAFLVEKDVFRNVVPLCRRNKTLISEVFSNPDQVMAKFVLNIYHERLNVSIHW